MSTNWDATRDLDEKFKKLREDAEADGIELNEESLSKARELLYNLLPQGADPTEEPSRLLVHKEQLQEDDEDEWQIPPMEG